MLWGLAPRKYLYYSVGVFNGDGIDVKDIDNHFDVMGRAYLAPLAFLRASETTRWLTEIWLGGSAWYSTHVLSPFLMPAVTTQGGFTLLPGSFAANALNLGYNGDAFKWAVELNAPIGPFGLRFELVRIDHEGLGLYDKPITQADRKPVAQLSRGATAFYVQAWYWIVGDYRMIPAPGQELPRKWAGYKPELGRWQLGLNVTAKYEHMQLNIAQDDSATLTEAQGAVLGGMTLDVAEVGANLWLSRHLRAQANYVMNYLSGDMKLAQSNPFFRTAEHELLLRMAVGL